MANTSIPATTIGSKSTRLSIFKCNSWLAPIVLILVLAAIVAVNSTDRKADWAWVWLATVALVTLAVAVVGGSVSGRIEGVFIDDRNRMSLSKFQMVLWTILVLSSLASAAAFNLQWGSGSSAAAAWRDLGGSAPANHQAWGPLDISIPSELLFAMGIAAGSFVATAGLLNLKADNDPQPASLQNATQNLGLSPDDTTSSGTVFGKSNAGLASWKDMFRGDEVTNANSPDLGKIQQFLITALLIGVYAASAWSMFAGLGDAARAVVVRLPPLSTGFVTLMAISHASYLAYKAAPHPATDPDSTPLTDPLVQAALAPVGAPETNAPSPIS